MGHKSFVATRWRHCLKNRIDLLELLIRTVLHQPFMDQIKILFWVQGCIKENPEFWIFHVDFCCFLFVYNVTCKNLPAPSRLLRLTYILNNTRGICAQVKNGSQKWKVMALTWGQLVFVSPEKVAEERNWRRRRDGKDAS